MIQLNTVRQVVPDKDVYFCEIMQMWLRIWLRRKFNALHFMYGKMQGESPGECPLYSLHVPVKWNTGERGYDVSHNEAFVLQFFQSVYRFNEMFHRNRFNGQK